MLRHQNDSINKINFEKKSIIVWHNSFENGFKNPIF